MSTRTNPYTKGRATNSTATSFASKLATGTAPSGDGVISRSTRQAAIVADNMRLIFWGAGSADQTFDIKAIGWNLQTDIWIPSKLFTAVCTLGTMPGIAGTSIDENQLFVDKIVVTGGDDNVNVRVESPEDNVSARIVFDSEGFQKLEVIFDMTGATSGNFGYSEF